MHAEHIHLEMPGVLHTICATAFARASSVAACYVWCVPSYELHIVVHMDPVTQLTYPPVTEFPTAVNELFYNNVPLYISALKPTDFKNWDTFLRLLKHPNAFQIRASSLLHEGEGMRPSTLKCLFTPTSAEVWPTSSVLVTLGWRVTTFNSEKNYFLTLFSFAVQIVLVESVDILRYLPSLSIVHWISVLYIGHRSPNCQWYSEVTLYVYALGWIQISICSPDLKVCRPNEHVNDWRELHLFMKLRWLSTQIADLTLKIIDINWNNHMKI